MSPDTPLQAVLAEPHDDDARLVYADWLLETGQPDLAALLRVQLARQAHAPWHDAQVALRARERALVSALDEPLRQALPELPGVHWRPRGFRRGLLAEAAFQSFAAVGQHGLACASRMPLEHARVPWPEDPGVALAAPTIRGLRELSLYDHITDPRQITWLARSPLLATVERLHLVTCGLAAKGLRELLAAPWARQLRSLRVVKNRIGNEGLVAVVEADLPALVALELSERADDDLPSPGVPEHEPLVDGDGIRALVGSPCFARLRHLSFSGHAIREPGLGALLGAPGVRGLETLSLRCQLDGPVRVPFEQAPPDLRLRVLDLGENLLDPASLACLRGPALDDLAVLRLDHCFTDPRTFHQVDEVPWLSSLRELELSDTDAEPLLEPLLRCRGLSLRSLGMANGFRYYQAQQALYELITSSITDPLLELDLSGNYMDDAFAEALMASSHLSELQVLHLGGHQFGPAATATLAASRLGRRLVSLDLEGPSAVPERFSW